MLVQTDHPCSFWAFTWRCPLSADSGQQYQADWGGPGPQSFLLVLEAQPLDYPHHQSHNPQTVWPTLHRLLLASSLVEESAISEEAECNCPLGGASVEARHMVDRIVSTMKKEKRTGGKLVMCQQGPLCVGGAD